MEASSRDRQESGAMPSLVLKADHGLAAEPAVAQLFEHLPRAIQFNRRADARSDRPGSKHAGNLVQPLW